jgi:hypothetical protein
LIGALLRLHDEGVALVEVDEAGARRAIGIGEPDRILEAVAITRRIARRRLRRIDAQEWDRPVANGWKLARSAALEAVQRSMKASIGSSDLGSAALCSISPAWF